MGEGAVEQTQCGVIEARCACILPPHHDGPHACGCGGVYSDRAERVYHWPVREGMLNQAQAIEHQAKCVANGPADPLAGLARMFGPDWVYTE